MDVSVSVLPVSETACREKASSFVETVIEAHSLSLSETHTHRNTKAPLSMQLCVGAGMLSMKRIAVAEQWNGPSHGLCISLFTVPPDT